MPSANYLCMKLVRLNKEIIPLLQTKFTICNVNYHTRALINCKYLLGRKMHRSLPTFINHSLLFIRQLKK